MNRVSDCYNEVFIKILDLQEKYSDLMIAGNMMAHALKIYKTILNDEEFENMMETLVESKNKIEPHNRESLH